ncbi:hexosaminidase [Cellulosimicrobium cellulans J34]|nr:hexosaminidase [Cellulosimicrobium cellulans J34]SMF22242.1 N-acetyl-beta-hexosaminidase [Cellulosimicrobium cellulans J1]
MRDHVPPPARRRTTRGAAVLTAAGLALAGSLAVTAPSGAVTAAPENLALAGTASASSTEQNLDWLAPRFVNDGDASTRWSSSYDDANWVQVELAEPSPVDHVTISWPGACAADYVVQTSTDGTTWTDRERVTIATCWRTDVVQLGVTEPVRFVRMQGIDRASQWGYSIYELGIYAAPQAEPDGPALVPQPAALSTTDDEPFALDAASVVAVTGDTASGQPVAEQLAEVLRPSTGYAVPVVEGKPADAANDVVIDVSPGNVAAEHAAEGYVLSASADGVRIGADTAQGARLGVQTLRQLLPSWVESPERVDVAWTAPAVEITDHPRFAYRGIMLDPARSFLEVEEVLHVIDGAAQLKLNVLHLHLTDDQGWRIAIEQPEENPSGIDYGLLTEVSGATAVYSNDGTTVLGSEPGLMGYYTQDDYTAIVEHAAARGMTVVPEIDLPGHINSALHAIPQLNSAGSAPKPLPGQTTSPVNRTTSVGESTLDADNPATYEFLATVLTQVAELTPGPYLHVGGDEAFSTSHADYLRVVDWATDYVSGLGKTVVGWNEYASSDLPRGSVVQYWNGGAGAVADAVATKDATVVLSPANKTYLPQKQDSRMPIGATWACGGPCGLQQFYDWDPATLLAGVTEADVAGVEAPLWSEWVRRVDEAEYLVFPRLLATAEVAWSPQSAKTDYATFTEKVGAFGGRLALADHAHFPTADVPWRVEAAGRGADAVVGEPATVAWTVTAPGLSPADVEATVEWDDGVTEPVSLTSTRATDIAALTINDPLRGASGRTFDAAGERTATLRVARPGRADVTAAVTVTVAAADAVAVEASARCLAGTAYVAVRATNGGADAVDVTLATAHGRRDFAGVAPGRSAYASFSTRTGEVAAGSATVTVDGVDRVVAHDAAHCS